MTRATPVSLTNEQLAKMPAFKTVNSEATDKNSCGVIALAIAFDIPYADAFQMLADRGRKAGCGTQIDILKDALSTRFDLYEEFFGFKSDKRLDEMCAELPSTGTHLIYTDEHVMAYKEGNLEDWYRFALDPPPVLGFMTLLEKKECLLK